MNQAEQREAYAADQVIQEAKYRAGFWMAFEGLEKQDLEAATLAILVSAAKRYAEQTGVGWKRLLYEVDGE